MPDDTQWWVMERRNELPDPVRDAAYEEWCRERPQDARAFRKICDPIRRAYNAYPHDEIPIQEEPNVGDTAGIDINLVSYSLAEHDPGPTETPETPGEILGLDFRQIIEQVAPGHPQNRLRAYYFMEQMCGVRHLYNRPDKYPDCIWFSSFLMKDLMARPRKGRRRQIEELLRAARQAFDWTVRNRQRLLTLLYQDTGARTRADRPQPFWPRDASVFTYREWLDGGGGTPHRSPIGPLITRLHTQAFRDLDPRSCRVHPAVEEHYHRTRKSG